MEHRNFGHHALCRLRRKADSNAYAADRVAADDQAELQGSRAGRRGESPDTSRNSPGNRRGAGEMGSVEGLPPGFSIRNAALERPGAAFPQARVVGIIDCVGGSGC